jgi:hypothetical protein
MAEMLAQQAYQPGDIQNAPIPRGAPLVQGLQAFLAARAARKADEAEEGAMKAQTQEARDFLNTLTRPREDFDKTMNLGQVLQIGTPELVDGQLRYPDISTEAPNLKMIPQEGPRVQLGRKPEDDQVYMPAAVSRFTATGRETDPQRMAAMLANPEFKSSFTDEQLLEKRRNLALEGMLTSQNPLVQKIAQMQYGAMQPKQLEIGAVNLADLTPASATKFAASGDPRDIVYRPSQTDSLIGKPSPGDFTTTSLAEFNRTGDYSKLQRVPKEKAGVNITNILPGEKTANRYSEELAGFVAKQDAEAIAAGENAIAQIESSHRVRDLLAQNPITGTGAEARLGFEKALSAAGFSKGDRTTITENLSAELAKTTLSTIRSSGLGSGQGFTDKDRDFLEKASSGKLELTRGNLQYLAELNEKAGRAAIAASNRVRRRARELPQFKGLPNMFPDVVAPAPYRSRLPTGATLD